MSQESVYKNSDQSDNYVTYKFVVKNVKKSTCLKLTYGHSGNDYRVATLSNLYLTSTGITIQSLKSIGQF